MLWRSCAKPVLLVSTSGNSHLEQIVTPANSVCFWLANVGYTRLMSVDTKDTFSDYLQHTISGRRFPRTSSQTTGFPLLLIPERISGRSKQSKRRISPFGLDSLIR